MISLHEPVFDETDESFVIETLRTAWVSTAGPFVDRFEQEFAEFVGMRHAISVCNGTLGLQLAIEVLRRSHAVTESFDVIVPTLTFIATANAVVHAGGYPIFADAAAESMNLCPHGTLDLVRRHYDFNSKAQAWHSKTTGHRLLAVMPAHLMGWTCDMDAMRSICDELHLPLLEDAAEALGCYERDGTHVGHHGLAAVYSFNGNKILTTGGGGMVVTNDDVVREARQAFEHYGEDRWHTLRTRRGRLQLPSCEHSRSSRLRPDEKAARTACTQARDCRAISHLYRERCGLAALFGGSRTLKQLACQHCLPKRSTSREGTEGSA